MVSGPWRTPRSLRLTWPTLVRNFSTNLFWVATWSSHHSIELNQDIIFEYLSQPDIMRHLC